MRHRQRIPTIFSIYMVDVLCCALGCVILLWLINFRDAKQRSAAASETGKRLAETRYLLDTAHSELAGLRSDITAAHERERDLQSRLNDTRMARDTTEKALTKARTEQAKTRQALAQSEKALAALRIEIKDAQTLSADTAAKLRLKAAQLAALMKKLAAVERKSMALNSELAKKTQSLKDADLAAALLATEFTDLKKLGDDYKSKLTVAEARARLLDDDLRKNKKELRDMQRAQELLAKRLLASTKDLKSARGNLLDVEKDLKAKLADAEARARLLEGDVAKGKKDLIALAEQARMIRQAAERRFAGIALTGSNVLFLVDMSGSMDLTDESTPDPDKWPLVCETVARIMESLADLRKYQVILFSDRVRYPLGNDGSWLRYNPESSAKTVLRALKAIKPNGETNMAAVFDEAFRFRADALDTIYVLSDGLPNAGPGLPAASQNLTDTQKTEVLSKYVRNRLKYTLNRAAPGQPRVRINTIGFFFESPDVGAFLWALAREHNGSFVGMSK
jgi:hypothetical protein